MDSIRSDISVIRTTMDSIRSAILVISTAMHSGLDAIRVTQTAILLIPPLSLPAERPNTVP
jgi:hypothetical protein